MGQKKRKTNRDISEIKSIWFRNCLDRAGVCKYEESKL